jgi:hypothetical protein
MQFNLIPVSHLKPIWVFAPNFCKIRFPAFWTAVYSLQSSRNICCDDDDYVLCAFCTSQFKSWHNVESAYFDMTEKPFSPLLGRLEMLLNSHLTLISSKISVGGCRRVCAAICKCNSLTLLLRSCFPVNGMRPLTFIESAVSWNPAKVSTKYA